MSVATELLARTVSTRPASTVHVGRHVMSSEQTGHMARYVGDGRWAVDYLPGRQLTKEQAVNAMKVAVASSHQREVGRWAASLGLTAAEAVGLAAMRMGAAAEQALGVDR
ncbi:hypothetical protein AB0H00_29590 [Nocardia sp. NPDC023852]|uniref:hypothetical protein n=1 Tax=Nocardia sp. NPDC023852 TaxID=3154697 RepID=UPI003403B4C3